MLKSKDFNGFVSSVPATMEKIAETTPVCVLKHVVSLQTMQMMLEGEITKLAARMNVAHNMNSSQIIFTAETLLEDFKFCSLEDFIFVFKQMAKGAYGSTYHELDTAVISICMQEHLEQKAYYQERNNTMAESSDQIPDVDYQAFKQRRAMEVIRDKEGKEDALKAERERQLKDLKYQEERLKYKPDEEKGREILLRQQWRRECFDYRTGDKKDNWLPFEQWKIKKTNENEKMVADVWRTMNSGRLDART